MASMTNTLLSSNCFSSQVLLSSPTPQNFKSLPSPYRKSFEITQSIHNKNPNSQSIIKNFPTQATLASLPFFSITPQALAVDTDPPPNQIQSQPTNQTPSFSQNPLLTAPKPQSTSDLPEGSQWRYSEFLNAAKKGEVERVRFSKDGGVLRLTAFDDRRASVTVPNDPDLIDLLAMNGVDISEGESGLSFAASLSTSQLIARGIIRGMAGQSSSSVPRVKASAIIKYDADRTPVKRRDVIHMAFSFSSFLIGSCYAEATGLPPEEKPKLCDNTCEKELENVSMVTTPSGLQYKDIKIGAGPSPPIGFQGLNNVHQANRFNGGYLIQVAANYVAMVPSGQIFDSSLEKGQIYIFRVGSGQVIKGLDEGVLSMKTGGKRRFYIPGSLAFPKGLTSAPGRPRVAPNSPVIFDVSLEYIPGLDDEE